MGAQLLAPKGLAFDSQGNLYVADGCVRKIAAGTISTFAGQCTLPGTGFTSGASAVETEDQPRARMT